ncbi:MAG: amino acid kinase family protein, partial [Promethearchaeota archaeon]
MLYHSIIVKIGGKILENKENLESTIAQFKHICENDIVQKIIIIPGGGTYANFVRKIDEKISIGDELSHWMAIFAMNCNGIELSQKYNDIKYFDNLGELKKSNGRIVIFLPYDFINQRDELLHSWDVTSDSITVYIAHQLGLKECFLIKDIDGIISNKNKILRELTTSEYKNLKNTNKILTINANQEEIKDSQPIDS